MDGVSVISAMHGDGRAIDQAAMLAAMLLLPTRAPDRGERPRRPAVATDDGRGPRDRPISSRHEPTTTSNAKSRTTNARQIEV